MDREIGRLLATLDHMGIRRSSLVVLVSDHGESLGEHGHVGHISQLYETLVHVPLIFSSPGNLPGGTVIDHPVSLVDLFPTILDILGLDQPNGLHGRSLMSIMRGESMSPESIIAATYQPAAPRDSRALVHSTFKYIMHAGTRRRELYDLKRDPNELQNIVSSDPATARKMETLLTHELAAIDRAAPRSVETSQDDLEQLEALGYLQPHTRATPTAP